MWQGGVVVFYKKNPYPSSSKSQQKLIKNWGMQYLLVMYNKKKKNITLNYSSCCEEIVQCDTVQGVGTSSHTVVFDKPNPFRFSNLILNWNFIQAKAKYCKKLYCFTQFIHLCSNLVKY